MIGGKGLLEIAEYERGRYKAFPKGVWTGDFMNNDSLNSLTCQVYYQFASFERP